MNLRIQALELNVTPEEMQKHIPPDVLQQTKGKGILQAYRLAHEGNSSPRVIGKGKQRLHWSRAIIRRLSDMVKSGTKFFVRHGETNEHEGRKAVGQVLASYVKDIGGKISNVVVGHFPDANAVNSMDVCSVEADVHIEGANVGDINEVSGIALSQSDVDKPAFAGASRLAVLQCFEEENQQPVEAKKVSVTFTEVKDFVREHNVFPHQLYSQSEFRNDREFAPVFDANDKLKKENEALVESNKQLTAEKESLSHSHDLFYAKERFDKAIPDNLTDKQRRFIVGRFSAEAVAEMDDAALKQHFENERKTFADTVKLLGVAEESPPDMTPTNIGVESNGELSPEDAALKLIGVV